MKEHRPHLGLTGVKVGPYQVYPTGTQYLNSLPEADLYVALELNHLFVIPDDQPILNLPLPDFGGVPENWNESLVNNVLPALERGFKVVPFCIGSHGRTGCFIASLIALLEDETVDPIVATRERHCHKAVETLQQARAIFAIRGEELPNHYNENSFWRH